jgi:hypothetical protein
MESTPPHTEVHPVARLSRGEFWVCFLGAMAVFFLFQGPLWKHRWQLDASIFYSYLAVPALVGLALVYRRKWALGAFALGTLEIVVWKFGATYVIAHTLWMFSTPPPKPEPVVDIAPQTEPALVPTLIAKEATGAIEGSVTDGDAGDVTRAVVFIATGLESYTFNPSSTGTSLSVGTDIEPGVAVAELHQELRARSSDGRLHTLIAGIEDADLFNMPLQSSGAWSSAKVLRGQGVAKLRCAVHQHSREVGSLVVVGNPFHAALDPGGRFRWEGVPAGRIRVQALDAVGRAAHVDLEVAANRSTTVDLVLEDSGKPPPQKP